MLEFGRRRRQLHRSSTELDRGAWIGRQASGLTRLKAEVKVMKKTKSVLYLLIVFFAGSLTSSIHEWLQPITTIRVTNASDQVIERLDIQYSSSSAGIELKGRIGASIAPGERVVFKGPTYSEASYQLTAHFVDGSQITGGSGYVERGKTTADAVSKDKVMTTTWSFFMPYKHETTLKRP